MVPEDDEVWQFIHKLINIIDSILLFEICELSIESFKTDIEEHNKRYLRLFKDNLKPKFHMLTHFPEVMAACSPVRKFWSLHYEAKHRIIKLYTHATTSRRNLSISIAKNTTFILPIICFHKLKVQIFNALKMIFPQLIASKIICHLLSLYEKVLYKKFIQKIFFFCSHQKF